MFTARNVCNYLLSKYRNSSLHASNVWIVTLTGLLVCTQCRHWKVVWYLTTPSLYEFVAWCMDIETICSPFFFFSIFSSGRVKSVESFIILAAPLSFVSPRPPLPNIGLTKKVHSASACAYREIFTLDMAKQIQSLIISVKTDKISAVTSPRTAAAQGTPRRDNEGCPAIVIEVSPKSRITGL